MKALRRAGILCAATLAVSLAVLSGLTLRDTRDAAGAFDLARASASGAQIVDRRGAALSASYLGAWNESDFAALHEIPEFLRRAFVAAEDKRFFSHGGEDWIARAAALWQNLRCLCADRGASTITEQVVRMLVPRPRTLYTRWIEGWDARRLERHASKADILEFYLNQVPYAANRRGVTQAARALFDRDVSTLSRREMLALAVLVRSPSGYRFRSNPERVSRAVQKLAQQMGVEKEVAAEGKTWFFAQPKPGVEASHFVRFARERAKSHGAAKRIRTTLDSRLQTEVQGLLDRRVAALGTHGLRNGAALVADHRSGEILAWVNAGAGFADTPGSAIDAVRVPRQPGSALKPFVYALALEKGWTAAEIIDDAPLAEQVGEGVHNWRNYSRRFYGPVTLRQALANSLNVPAIRAARFAGPGSVLKLLRSAGFESLEQNPDFYGEGIALGNGEVTLFELVGGYAMLANRGVRRPLRVLSEQEIAAPSRRVLREETASLVSDILSDSAARGLEFGADDVLDLPVQTAVKTGTSTDFRDAWAVGFNHRYVVGVWMGNLDRRATDGVSGALGPSLLLRSIFAELNRAGETRPLYLSPALSARSVCVPVPGNERPCVAKIEWFAPGTVAEHAVGEGEVKDGATKGAAKIVQPIDGMRIALDPRVPQQAQAFVFRVEGAGVASTIWRIDGSAFENVRGTDCSWPISRGAHKVEVDIYGPGGDFLGRDSAGFLVR